MNIIQRLARRAARLLSDPLRWRKPGSPEIDDIEKARRSAARSLRTRLPDHLRKDIGADDG